MLRATGNYFGAFTAVLLYTLAGTADLHAQEQLPIVHHDVDLHSCPAPECRVITRLPILSYVRVQDRVKTRTGEEDREEHWVHVAAGGSGHTGWIVEGHIGYTRTFAPVRSWRVEAFHYCIGEYCPAFRFTAAGAYTVMFPACFDGLCDPPNEVECSPGTEKTALDGWVHCRSGGHLYRAGDVIRPGGPDSHEFLYFDKLGRLCADPWTCQASGENRTIN